MAGVEQRIGDLGARSLSEAAQGGDFMTLGATLPAFLRANKQQKEAAHAELLALRNDHAKQLGQLQQARMERKRYERLAETRAKRQAEELLSKEQKAIDDLMVIKAGRSSKRSD
jgi:flagellar export protein FliJ